MSEIDRLDLAYVKQLQVEHVRVAFAKRYPVRSWVVQPELLGLALAAEQPQFDARFGARAQPIARLDHCPILDQRALSHFIQTLQLFQKELNNKYIYKNSTTEKTHLNNQWHEIETPWSTRSCFCENKEHISDLVY